MLDDARWVYSGMIYGFSVNWTPSSAARGVSEELSIEPLALIPFGDPKMQIPDVIRENGLLYIRLEYHPDSVQIRRIEGWQSQAFPSASGSGLSDTGSRRQAVELAVKETIRAWLRQREYNRPREIRGRAALSEFPLTRMTGAGIHADISLKLDLQPVRHYTAD